MEREYLSTKEASNMTGLSPAWFERARWKGDGPPFYKLAGRVLYQREQLVAWVEKHGPRSSTTEAANG